MPHFKEIINTSYGSLSFYFNQEDADPEASFHISVVDKTGKTYIFLMKKAGDQWKLSADTPVPHWIRQIEDRLHEFIRVYLIRRERD